ncbi:beta-galactosidase [Echinimonas agarilytica]|uniref:Beta-galactosidase n=1 Tax=Echinimonas agarilytica TaxID=1215918 RepID=A0AA41W7A7_9GAMM|nr:beta-galactosidase [Echinimonas agarilytica]MCM2679982.1 beta-galactosidase [Echinimonas agarilytica]
MNSKLSKTWHSKSILAASIAIALVACSDSSTTQDNTAVPASNADAFQPEQTLVTLVDFESPTQQGWLSSNEAKTALKHITDNTYVSVDFLSKFNMPTLVVAPEEPWAFDQFENYNFAFDAENTGDTSIQLYLNVENPKGKAQSRSISLAAGFKGTVYFPLKGVEAETEIGLWGDAPPWQTQDKLMIWRSWRSDNVNLDQVAALKFFTIGNLDDTQVALDNIRLRKNPETRSDWMKGVIDEFGQNAKIQSPLKIDSVEQLKAAANAELKQLDNSKGMPNRSQYGGYTAGPKLNATGYFRTEKVDGKWWMVDPEGHVFFSHGPANVRMANMSTLTGVDFKDDSVRVVHDDELTPEDSMGIVSVSDDVRSTRYVTSDIRHQMFNWLPAYDDELAEHYSYRRSTHKGAIAHGETYSFYRANLERRYGQTSPESYIKKWEDVTIQRMHEWGFTSFGNWVDPAFYQAQQVPYFANGWIIGNYKTLSGYKNHWGLMPDPYDPVFEQRAIATIDAIAKDVENSPWCAGIFIDNEKSWGERSGTVEERYGVILDALSKDSEQSPAKQAFTEHLQQKYTDIDQINAAWLREFESWEDVARSIQFDQYSAALEVDLSRMLEMLGEQYFKVVHGTLAEVMPNHLYMGARMANWGMPDEIIKASLKYSDVLSFNIYEEGMQDHFWKFLEDVDLPVVIGEFHIGTTVDTGMFNPGIVHAADPSDRAQMYKDYMQSVLNKPYMVGAHWFQYIDEPISGRAFDGENANIGFVTVTDIPYPQLIDAVKDVTSTMYQKRLAN